MARRGLVMTMADVRAHAARHGFTMEVSTEDVSKDSVAVKAVVTFPVVRQRMNATETEFAARLERSKKSGLILDYRYEGMKLAWGADPATGKTMIYTPDFVVFEDSWTRLKIIEVKGVHIFDRDLVRFKGCRAAWAMFQFEMHQKTKSGWDRIL